MELTLPIVGINHSNDDKAKTNRRSELMLLGPGTALELRLEPKNKHDSNAIGVWGPSGIQVGYVPAERAPWLGGRIRLGEEVQAILQGLTEHSGWMRVRIGGGVPSLPSIVYRQPSSPRVGDNDFHPDPAGPEWGV